MRRTGQRSTASLTDARSVQYVLVRKKPNVYVQPSTFGILAVASPARAMIGWATLSISSAGLTTMAGSLADGSAMSQSVSVSKDGRWPSHAAYAAPPASNGGAVFGWLSFSNQPATGLGGTLYWFRPAGNACAMYQSGFTNLAIAVIGSAYNPNEKPRLALTDGQGQVSLDGANLPFAIQNQCTLTPENTIIVAPPDTDKPALTISKSTGAITGSFANPLNAKQSTKITGVLLQNKTSAAGYFLGTNRGGAFLLNP